MFLGHNFETENCMEYIHETSQMAKSYQEDELQTEMKTLATLVNEVSQIHLFYLEDVCFVICIIVVDHHSWSRGHPPPMDTFLVYVIFDYLYYIWVFVLCLIIYIILDFYIILDYLY